MMMMTETSVNQDSWETEGGLCLVGQSGIKSHTSQVRLEDEARWFLGRGLAHATLFPPSPLPPFHASDDEREKEKEKKKKKKTEEVGGPGLQGSTHAGRQVL